MLMVLATARFEQIAWRFLRLVAVIVLAILAGALAWSTRDAGLAAAVSDWRIWTATLAAAASVTLVVLAPAAARAPISFGIVCAIGGVCGLAASAGFVLENLTTRTADPGIAAPGLIVLAVAGQSFSGLLLGSITLAWLLGHAYLTATRMTIAPLRHFTTILVWAVMARTAFVVLSLAVAWAVLDPSPRAPGRSQLVELMFSSWLIVVLRIGVGLLAVGVFAWMVRDCVRIRSTQSATGILYFGSLFAYVGELAAWQLAQQWGWPV